MLAMLLYTFVSVETADMCNAGARDARAAALLEEREANEEDGTVGAMNADAQSSVAAAATQVATTFMMSDLLKSIGFPPKL